MYNKGKNIENKTNEARIHRSIGAIGADSRASSTMKRKKSDQLGTDTPVRERAPSRGRTDGPRTNGARKVRGALRCRP